MQKYFNHYYLSISKINKNLLIFILISILNHCHNAYFVLISKKAIMKGVCSGSIRNYILKFENTHSVDTDHQGKIEIHENGAFLIDGIVSDYAMDTEFVEIYGLSLGSGINSIRLKISCPKSNEVLFDSGRVSYDEGMCIEKKNGEIWEYYLLDGKEKLKSVFHCDNYLSTNPIKKSESKH